MSALSLVSTSDGQQLAYRLEGETDRPVLVLSNSIATTLHMWDGIIPALRRHFRVLRYDARGHGESTAPRGPYSIARLGQDVLDLLDTLQIDRAHFLGLSLGGFVGQWLGANAPQRLRRLVLSNTSPYLGPPQQWDRLIESVLRAPHMAEAADRFLGNWFPPSMRRGGAGVAAQFHAMVMRTPAAGLAGNYAAVRDADLRPLLPRIAVPTLVIAGRRDPVTLPSHGEQIAAAVPGARLVMLDTVHLPNVEAPDAYLEAVLGFLVSAE